MRESEPDFLLRRARRAKSAQMARKKAMVTTWEMRPAIMISTPVLEAFVDLEVAAMPPPMA